MNGVKIRPAVVEDAPVIAQAVALAMGEESAAKLCGAEYLKVLEAVASACGTQYSYAHAFVAEASGVVVGAVVGYDGASLGVLRERTLEVIGKMNANPVVPEDETQAGEFYIDSIGVLPLYRGAGLGEHLLKAMAQMAFSCGFQKVGLIVDFENPRAAQLYSRCGFEVVGEKSFFGHRMHHLQCTQESSVQKILYTGLNYPQVREFCGDKILAPYICMGFSMLSLLGPDGFISVQEGDTICKDVFGKFWVEK